MYNNIIKDAIIVFPIEKWLNCTRAVGGSVSHTAKTTQGSRWWSQDDHIVMISRWSQDANSFSTTPTPPLPFGNKQVKPIHSHWKNCLGGSVLKPDLPLGQIDVFKIPHLNVKVELVPFLKCFPRRCRLKGTATTRSRHCNAMHPIIIIIIIATIIMHPIITIESF